MHTNSHKKSPGNAVKRPLSVISSVDNIMFRIQYAKPESPIAVFLHDKEVGLVAVFGDCVKTRNIATAKNKNFIGMYHKNHDLKGIKGMLFMALGV